MSNNCKLISRNELIDYFMDVNNKKIYLVGGIGAGKTTLCKQFLLNNPSAMVFDIEQVKVLYDLFHQKFDNQDDLVRIAQSTDQQPLILLPGFEYLFLSTESNEFLPPAFASMISSFFPASNDAWGNNQLFIYRA